MTRIMSDNLLKGTLIQLAFYVGISATGCLLKERALRHMHLHVVAVHHYSNWTWCVEEILTCGNRLRSTHCREFLLETIQTS